MTPSGPLWFRGTARFLRERRGARPPLDPSLEPLKGRPRALLVPEEADADPLLREPLALSGEPDLELLVLGRAREDHRGDGVPLLADPDELDRLQGVVRGVDRPPELAPHGGDPPRPGRAGGACSPTGPLARRSEGPSMAGFGRNKAPSVGPRRFVKMERAKRLELSTATLAICDITYW